MNISVILAHPDPGSFNHAIAETAVAELRRNGHAAWFHDLYREGFDPLLTAAELSSKAVLPPAVAAHCQEIAEADGIVIVHANWWGQPPAILKGWIDRVVRPGVAYRFIEGGSVENECCGSQRPRRDPLRQELPSGLLFCSDFGACTGTAFAAPRRVSLCAIPFAHGPSFLHLCHRPQRLGHLSS
jgi:hypothetical protein